jgi:hypothetical protein
MTDLAEDIRQFVEQGIRPVTVDEVWTQSAGGAGPRHQSGRRVLALAAASVVVLAIVLIAVLVAAPAGGPGGPSSAAAAELRLLASRAADVPSLGPGQYFYSEIERQTNEIGGSYTPGGPAIEEYLNGTQQTWVNAQGYGQMVITTDPTPQFFTQADRAAWIAAGSPPVPVPPNQLHQVVAITPTWAGGLSSTPIFHVADLPTDPNALEQVLASGRFTKQLTSSPFCSARSCTVVAAAAALLQGPDIGATPALRSALFEVLAHVPGVADLGTITDDGGETGIGLSFSHTTPANTLETHCATGGSVSHSENGIIVTPAEPPTIGPAIPFQVPASTSTLELIIDPDTTSVVGTQETTTPDMQPVPNVCPGQPGYGSTPKLGYVAPEWTDVLSEGVVDSDSAVPAGQ